MEGVKVKYVNTQDITDIACNGVFVSIGRKPATEFLGSSVALDPFGYVIHDESTKTNVGRTFVLSSVLYMAIASEFFLYYIIISTKTQVIIKIISTYCTACA